MSASYQNCSYPIVNKQMVSYTNPILLTLLKFIGLYGFIVFNVLYNLPTNWLFVLFINIISKSRIIILLCCQYRNTMTSYTDDINFFYTPSRLREPELNRRSVTWSISAKFAWTGTKSTICFLFWELKKYSLKFSVNL